MQFVSLREAVQREYQIARRDPRTEV